MNVLTYVKCFNDQTNIKTIQFTFLQWLHIRFNDLTFDANSHLCPNNERQKVCYNGSKSLKQSILMYVKKNQISRNMKSINICTQ